VYPPRPFGWYAPLFASVSRSIVWLCVDNSRVASGLPAEFAQVQKGAPARVVDFAEAMCSCKTLPTWAVDARAHAFGPLGVEDVGVERCECLWLGLGGVDPPLPLVQPASTALATDATASTTTCQRP
jgi:hypothetical protein